MVEATTPSASIPVRIVPGAPPPVPPTKSQLKKRKQKTAKARTSGEEGLDSSKDTAPADLVPNSTSLGGTEEEKKTTEAGPEPELALHPSTIALEGQKPPSPIVDQIINRRIKALGKKIVCSRKQISPRFGWMLTLKTFLATHRSSLVETGVDFE
jgi:hypothetical protein